MNTTDTLTIAPRDEREIVITRRFDAPRERVFEAFTTPALLRRWFEMTGPDDVHMVIFGEYREVAPPSRLVTTEQFEEDWTGGETVVTTTFDALAGATAVTIAVEYASSAARDGALASGMETGMAESYARLDDLLAGR